MIYKIPFSLFLSIYNYVEGILFLIRKKILYKAQEAAKITGTKVKINLIIYFLNLFYYNIIKKFTF